MRKTLTRFVSIDEIVNLNMTREERLDKILSLLINSDRNNIVKTKYIKEQTGLSDEVLNDELNFLAHKEKLIYYQEYSIDDAVYILEEGRDFLVDKGGFTKRKTQAEKQFNYTKDAVFWAKIAALIGFLALIVAICQLCSSGSGPSNIKNNMQDSSYYKQASPTSVNPNPFRKSFLIT